MIDPEKGTIDRAFINQRELTETLYNLAHDAAKSEGALIFPQGKTSKDILSLKTSELISLARILLADNKFWDRIDDSSDREIIERLVDEYDSHQPASQ